MNHPRTSVSDEVRSVVAMQLSVDRDRILDDASFVDLGADSLDRIEIAMALEERFAIEIEDHEVDGVITIGDAIARLEKRMNGHG